MNGNLPLIVEDAKKLGDAVFGIYPTLAEKYTTTIGPVVSAEQQKILFDLAVACLGIANKESRVSMWKEEKKNGNGNNGNGNGNEHKNGIQHDDVMSMPVKETDKTKTETTNGTTDKTTEDVKMQNDTRDRPTEQLIQELNIKTPKQAGFLRFKKEISYKEWHRIKNILSAEQIRNGGDAT